jgi:hypothetical protein
MRKKITTKWLRKIGACQEAVEAFAAQKETDPVKVLQVLLKKRPDWGNWLITRLMGYKQYVAYAIYAAEQVIEIFEKRNPGDKRPREAIEAAKRCLKNPDKKNKAASYAAADAAFAATSAADAAFAATSADAAASAAYAATSAADAAFAAYAAASYAADTAADASAGARQTLQRKILAYGFKLYIREG